MRHTILVEDLDHILRHTEPMWRELDGERLFITGGTGFFGKWLLAALLHANDRLGIDIAATVLTRNPARFKAEAPDLAGGAIALHQGDLASFDFPDGRYSHVLHMGTTSSTATFNNEPPLAKYENIAGGTERTLEFAVRCGASRFHLTSSGAIYGRQPDDIPYLPEDFTAAPDPTDTAAAVGHSKRIAEFLTVAHGQAHDIHTTISRCFSFIGAHLPLDIHYAVGNFLRDARAGGPIVVRGDGLPQRSYLYAADLVIWLIAIMFNGAPGRAYNVGSDEDVTIGDLAQRVANHASPPLEVRIGRSSLPTQMRDRYVPSIERARNELGLTALVRLDDAIGRTLRSLRRQ